MRTVEAVCRGPRGYLPADVLLLVYFVLTGILILASPLSPEAKGTGGLCHFLFLLAVAGLRFLPRDGVLPWRFVRMTYPLIGLPFFYKEVQFLNRLTTDGYYDAVVIPIEQGLFGSQPSQILHELLPWPLLSEYLHFGYAAYVLLIPTVGLYLFFTRRDAALRIFTTTVLGVFLFCYTIFTLFPVRGPFQHFGPIPPEQMGHLFPQVVRWILDRGSSIGTAFPSSHVAAAVAIWLVARRVGRGLGWLVLPITVGIFFGTVYGGYHYAVDALAGLVVGLWIGTTGPGVHARLARFLGMEAESLARPEPVADRRVRAAS